MKIVIAPDSFKESMTAQEACDSIERGIKKVFSDVEIIKVPMADGGEGTFQSLTDAARGKIIEIEVHDPLGNKKMASYGISGDGKTAFMEMAQASGLGLVPKDKRNPLYTSTYGTGELIKDALERKVDHIIIGIGGSATNDGGAGMAQALGARLLDKNGNDIEFGALYLKDLDRIDQGNIHERIKNTKITVACDVNNPLTGPKGASYIFGPQKGATPEIVEQLDGYLKNYARIIKKDLGKDIEEVSGAGAAGGLGGGLMAFLDARLEKGINIVIDYTKLREKLEGADLVITGEGGIDSQTRFGKTPFGVANEAKKFNIPVIALAGNVKEDSKELYDYGFDAIFPITQGAVSLDKALEEGQKNLEITAENIARLIKIYNKK